MATLPTNPAQSFPQVQSPAKFTFTGWRPYPFKDPDIDLAMKTIFDSTYGLKATAVTAVSALQGSKMSSGAITVPAGGSMKAIASGLGTLSNIIASIDNGSTPTNMTVSATPNTVTPGTFDLFVFQPTSSSVNTPVLATTPVLIRWHAWGT